MDLFSFGPLTLGTPIPAPLGNVSGLGCYAPAAIPKETRIVSTYLDFTIAGAVELSFTELLQRNMIDKVQTIYVDNKDGTVPIDFIVDINGQRITIPAGYQGFLPVLVGGNVNKVTAYSLGNTRIYIQLMNIFVPTNMWNAA